MFVATAEPSWWLPYGRCEKGSTELGKEPWATATTPESLRLSVPSQRCHRPL